MRIVDKLTAGDKWGLRVPFEPLDFTQNPEGQQFAYGAGKEKSAAFDDACPTWLAWANSFRTYDWAKALPDPHMAIKQIRQLLALV